MIPRGFGRDPSRRPRYCRGVAEGPPFRQIGRFDDLGVQEYACRFGPEDRPFEEQHATYTIGVVYEGTFQYRSGSTTMTMTPGSAILGNPGDAFTCSHEHGRGDRCVSVSLGPETLQEIAREAGVRRAAFRHPVSPTHARARCATARFAKSRFARPGRMPPPIDQEVPVFDHVTPTVPDASRTGRFHRPLTHAPDGNSVEAVAHGQ